MLPINQVLFLESPSFLSVDTLSVYERNLTHVYDKSDYGPYVFKKDRINVRSELINPRVKGQTLNRSRN